MRRRTHAAPDGVLVRFRARQGVVFDFAVTGDLLLQGLAAALLIGLLAGLFPAIRAARMPVAQALRVL